MEKRLTMFMACLFLSLGMAFAQTKVTGTVGTESRYGNGCRWSLHNQCTLG